MVITIWYLIFRQTRQTDRILDAIEGSIGVVWAESRAKIHSANFGCSSEINKINKKFSKNFDMFSR